MEVLNHHIYEYKKGLRDLVLHTIPASCRDEAVARLKKNDIAYLICPVNSRKINIFFGEKECIAVLNEFGLKPLNEFTPEEDFILGTMLGYRRIDQCRRYLEQTQKQKFSIKTAS